ncbi:MAG: uncharacterized protein QOD90_5008, partial [Mycobacterium sp.]|nr:uncharacterized protein [Mycobacterium sp.]
GAGAGATATGPAPTDLPSGQPPAANPQPGQPPATPPSNQQGRAPEVPVPVAVPSGPTQLTAAKAAALQGVQTALDAMQSAQQSGNFAEYGQALQNLDDAMAKYRQAK